MQEVLVVIGTALWCSALMLLNRDVSVSFKDQLRCTLKNCKLEFPVYCALRWKMGFTLIELATVLVIIGLIVGGVLVGQDLVRAAEVRAQVSQIEKYNTAVNTFREKYNALPGDIPNAATFNFVPRAGSQARGDGNGIIEAYNYQCPCFQGLPYQSGETLFFWEDLAQAGLIDQTFKTAADSYQAITYQGTSISLAVPAAKIGGNNFVTVYSANSTNYFALSGITQIHVSGDTDTVLGLRVIQAYQIDMKVDDGLPTTGRVQANYPSDVTYTHVISSPTATTDSASTCYNSVTNRYSITFSSGNLSNCALSFIFQ